MNKCSDYNIRGCPASSYLICSAYKEGTNCWEAERDIPCCKRENKDRCKDCSVYKKALELGVIVINNPSPLSEADLYQQAVEAAKRQMEVM